MISLATAATRSTRTATRTRTAWLVSAVVVFAVAAAWAVLAVVQPQAVAFDRAPFLQSLTGTTVLIVSQSANPAIARLRWGVDPALADVVVEPTAGNVHIFALNGLRPAQRYFYQVTHGDAPPWPASSFTTLPGPGGTLTVAVVGDTGLRNAAQAGVLGVLQQIGAPMLLHLGDLAYPDLDPQTLQENFFTPFQTLLASTAVYPTVGNHDVIPPNTGDDQYWREQFALPSNNPWGDEGFYSFDAGDAHFVAVNTQHQQLHAGQPDPQLDWLAQDLAATAQRWKIAFLHMAPYSHGRYDGVAVVRDRIVPILEQHGVDLVLAAHDHSYERFYPLRGGAVVNRDQNPNFVEPAGAVYVVSGGGGGELYALRADGQFAPLSAVSLAEYHALKLVVTPSVLSVEAIASDGRQLDAFTIRKGAAVPTVSFRRGDPNNDGQLDISDAVAILLALFAGNVTICQPAGDVNGQNGVDLSDAISLLTYLFRDGTPPAAPFPGCSVLPVADAPGCVNTCR